MNLRSLSALAAIGCLVGGGLVAYGIEGNRATDGPHIGSRTSTLHNGWRLTPAGPSQQVGDMLLGGALSPDKKLFAVVNAGYNAHHLYLLDAVTGKVQQTLPLERAWNGVAWSADGAALYVAGGGLPRVHTFERNADGTFAPAAAFPLPDLAPDPPEKKGDKPDATKGLAYVSGLATSLDGKTLFVANFATDMLYALNLPDGSIRMQRKLDDVAHPYCLRLSPDGTELCVSQGALGSVAVLNTATLATNRTLFTDSHPNDLCFGPDGSLYVSCGNSDSVVVIDPKSGLIVERIAISRTPICSRPICTGTNSITICRTS